VQSGAYRAKAVMVISEHDGDIVEAIVNELKRGVTILKGIGGYTQRPKEVLYVVCSPRQIVRVKNLVHKIDPHAFITITDVHEVVGEGFTSNE